MKLVYATGNPAKLQSMRDRLAGLCRIEAPEQPLPDVDESGNNPLENAKLKAEAYACAYGAPVLAADSGLYIEGLPESEQPGVHVRRVKGQRLSDVEMTAHYAALAARFGGKVRAQYRNGLYIILGPGRVVATADEALGSEPLYLMDTPHETRREGFPLDSLSVEIASGQYYYDLQTHTGDSMMRERAYRDFICTAMTGLDEAALTNAKSCAEGYMAGDASGHDIFHAHRVWNAALRIAYSEPKADLAIVTLSALLHDIDDGKLTGETTRGGTKRTRAFLEQNGYAVQTVDAVCEIIATLSYKGANAEAPMSTPEGAIVRDADRLDAIGAIGIARAFAYGGTRGRPMHTPGAPPNLHMDEESYLSSQGTTIHHFYEKLLLLKDRMLTEAGRKAALERHAFLETYLERFLKEWEGEA